MNPIKKILIYILNTIGKEDERIYIQHYIHKQRKIKTNAVKITPVSRESKKKIKAMWGKDSWWFDFYNTVGDKDRVHLYIPDPWFYRYVDTKLNDWKVCRALDDKCFYDFYFKDVNCPKTIVKVCGGVFLDELSREIKLKEAAKLCMEAGGVIIKPSIESTGGKNIVFWKKDDGADIESILKGCKDVIIQALIEQHPTLSAIHPDSVNTIRILTITTEEGVNELSSILRMGCGNSKVDNVSSGGIAIGIDKNGVLRGKAFSGEGKAFERHPDGAQLEGVKVPSYHECLEICKATAPRFARFSRLISWDFAVGVDGKPILIEANLHYGELDFHQMCNGPIFGDEETTTSIIKKYIR